MIKTNIFKIFSPAAAFIIFLTLLPGCCLLNSDFSGINPGISEDQQQTDASAPATESVIESAVTETTEPVPAKFYFDEIIPEDIKDSISIGLKNDFENFHRAATRETADVLLEILPAEAEGSNKNILMYVPVVSFWSFFEESSSRDFIGYWNGSIETLKDITGKEFTPELIIRSSDLEVIEKAFGKCKVKQIKIAGGEEVITSLLEKNINSFSIIPFDEIKPKLKPVNLDGIDIFDKNLAIESYPIIFKVTVKGEDAELVEKAKVSLEKASFSNRNLSKLVTVIMTGVTALTRGTANKMDQKGILYPADKIASLLQNADITHISNEVSFVEDGNAAKTHTMVFCSRPAYIDLLKFVETDVIELTGNHLNDYGSKWLAYTLGIYEREGIPYFGGGRNLEESYKPATFEINGYKIAFVGANSFGPSSDWAGKDTPGSAPINMWDEVQKESDMQKMKDIVKDLKSKGFIVIFTFQYMETYNYHPTEEQVKDFRAMIDAGADIVSGSQAHQPMGVDFWGKGFINYGLGNLFFDQMQNLGVRQGIISKHIFYEGKHINTVLVTTMLEDYCQPRPTYGTERAELLKSIFNDKVK